MKKKIITLVFLLVFFCVSFIIINLEWQYPINREIVANNCNFRQQSHPPRKIIDYVEPKETLKTSNPGPHLNYYSFQVDDDNSGSSNGDADGNIDAGEIIELRLILNNSGDEDALNVNATLSSSNNNITITNNFQEFINIPQGSTGISSTFYVFKIASSCPSDYNITLDLQINASNGGPWYDTFQIHVIGRGNPVYQTFSVISESTGDLTADNDEIIDPGEVIVFDIKIKNIGGSHIYGITGVITETDSYVSIDDNSGDFGTINSNGATALGTFGIIISGACPDKHQIDFNLNLTDAESTKWQSSFIIIVNGTANYTVYNFEVIEYSGDDNNNVDAGEILYAGITIKNIGSVIGKSISVYFDSSDPYISFNSDNRIISYGNLNPNETHYISSNSEWRFTILEQTPLSHIITFKIRITDSSGYYQYFYKTIQISGKITNYEILEIDYEQEEGYGNGNEDDNIEPGEEWRITLTIRSIAEIAASNVHAYLKCDDDFLSFEEEDEKSVTREFQSDNIKKEEGASLSWIFDISDKEISSDYDIEIIIIIFDSNGQVIKIEEEITVVKGANPFLNLYPPLETQLIIFLVTLSIVLGIIFIIELIGRSSF